MTSNQPPADVEAHESSYPNRRELPPTAPVWRYLSLRALLHTLRERKLRFTRIDTFDDPFEGSVPDQEVKDIVPQFVSNSNYSQIAQLVGRQGMEEFGPPPEDNLIRLTRLRRAKTRSAHAACWTEGDDTEPPWRMYCVDDGPRRGTGVAIKTTLQRLEESLSVWPDVLVSPINYRDYEEPGFRFTCELDALMHKRIGFKAETEVRALMWNLDHYSKLALAKDPPPELPAHICVDWPVADTISAIVISPYADEVFEEMVRHLVGMVDKTLADRVELSRLHPRHKRPNF
jgi:hypothetical protein